MSEKKPVTPRYTFEKATYVNFIDRTDFKLARYHDISLEGFSCYCNKTMAIGDVLRVEINLKMVSGGLIDDIYPHIAVARLTSIEPKNNQTIYEFKFTDFAENCFDNLTKAIDYLDKKENLVSLPDLADDNIQAQKTVEDLVNYIVERVQAGQIPLPVLPDIVSKIENTIQDPNAGTDELASVIQTDAVISGKILSIVNSAFYQTSSHINSIGEAALRLGTLEVQSLVLTIANKSIYKTTDKLLRALLEKLWQYSLAAACNAHSLSIKLDMVPHEKYFSMGLVHNIGQTLLLRVIGEMIEHHHQFNAEDIINTTLRFSPELSRTILAHWKLPEEYIQAAGSYPSPFPDAPPAPHILVIHLASLLAKDSGFSLTPQKIDFSRNEAARHLGLAPSTLKDIGETTKKRLEESMDSFRL